MTDWVKFAYDQVLATWGDKVLLKNKPLLKFGKNDSLGTSQETVWLRGGHETLPTSNVIDKISSSDNGDTQSLTVEGHTLSGSDFTFVTQTLDLAGRTETALTTPLARATRAFNNDNTDFAGTVYVYEDDTVTNGVPQTTSKIHLQTEGTNNQTMVVNEKTAATVDFQFQIGEYGKVFRTRIPASASSDGPAFYAELKPFLIVPSNADFRIAAASSASNTSVEAWANGALALVQ